MRRLFRKGKGEKMAGRKKFKCPECGKEIDDCNVYSQCKQVGVLDGNKVVDYSEVKDILETIGIECPLCHQEIQDHLEER